MTQRRRLTEEDVEAYRKGWPSPFTKDEHIGQAWGAMKVEQACQEFSKRTGIPREEVGIVVSLRTKQAYLQWKYAIPDEMRTK